MRAWPDLEADMTRPVLVFDRALRADQLAQGLFAQTLVATPQGWRPAHQLYTGDTVLTVGSGPMSICGIDWEEPPLWQEHLPAGACGNRRGLSLPPGQSILIETEAAVPITGEPFALVPAMALEGWRGVEPREGLEAPLRLRLEGEEMIYAGPGLILGCAALPGQDWRDAGAALPTPLLPLAEARELVARLIAEDLAAALSQAAFGGA
jgi:hypothetical protein